MMRAVRAWLGIVVACAAGVACREGTGARHAAASGTGSAESSGTTADPSASASAVAASASASAASASAASASASAPPQYWTAASKQPTTTEELQAFTGHWRVTGSSLKLFAHRDGIALMFTVEEDTAAYRKGELRFELEMALNGTGFSVWDHSRPEPGGKTYGEDGLWKCAHTMTVTTLDPYYEYLDGKVIDADTLRVHRVIWTTTFELGADGKIARCANAQPSGETWDELRRVK